MAKPGVQFLSCYDIKVIKFYSRSIVASCFFKRNSTMPKWASYNHRRGPIWL